MSYARFGWDGSDVYVYMDVNGYLNCCMCLLQDVEWVEDETIPIFEHRLEPIEPIIETRFYTTQGMIDHLAKHREAGHTVPEGIEDELRADDKENFSADR